MMHTIPPTSEALSARTDGSMASIPMARFCNSAFLIMEYDCPYGVNARVGSLLCFNCEHYIKADFANNKTLLCAYNYDKEKEKPQEEDKFHRKNNSSLNS